MTASEDNRCDQRFACKIPIVVSHFNSRHCMDAFLMDHGMEGISFVSTDAFLLGTAVIIRVASRPVKDSCSSDLEMLPSISVGEVKWCRKIPDGTSTAFEVGIKYFPQVY
jgi:hypothetical protein